MKQNIIKIALAGVLATGLVSCDKFLNRPAEDNYNVDNFYQNDAQCIQGVNYLYNSPWNDFTRPLLWVGEIMSGNLFQGNNRYLDLSVNSTDDDLKAMSYSLWAVNGHANTVIMNIRNAEGPSQGVKNQCIGEALTWKAFAYFFMVRSFGEIPIIHDNNEVLTSGQYNNVYKATRANVYEYIVMTLEKAMELLPKSGVAANGRIDYYAAEALLAKVYLTKAGVSGKLDGADLAKAAEYAKDVIDNSGRDLMEEYSDVFRLANNINKECLISLLWNAGRDPWTQQNRFQPEIAMTGFSDFEESCWGGWTGPSVDLQDAFGVSATDNPELRAAEKDKRRKATMMMAGDTYSYFWTDKGGFDYLRFIYDADDYGKGGPSGEYQSPTGANMVKHLTGRQADHVAGTGTTAMNMATSLATHLLRFSDVLLIYAEAKMGTSKSTTDADAIEAFNRVRRRAGVEEVSGTLTWEQVWKERRLELALEGDRWYDFVRRSYYDMEGAINEIKSQRRNEWYGLNALYEPYYTSGNTVWNITDDVKYNTDTPAPNVTAGSFTLPFPTEDLVFNPNLAKDAVDVDVRSTYSYDF
ncbi:MAG: RagB/SusD family nutrient uptake outer membrane protein [Bacteroidales bacterium]|nr:RagB/SusD family nutrient uptake outer membrane protein [Bacteroides sp.]MCM1197782.1 RagB/SusD family nutrient uptake outer membrane protein [Clostridium sp.]MCM1502800.1 RagB/SusD family nutrient uptake outer membrane protein [Bacteroidales bacterium]